MRENDIIFFNLHRRYLNQAPKYGGFIGTFILAAVMNANGFFAQGYAGTLQDGIELIDEACSTHKVRAIGLYCDYENVTENIFLSRYIKKKYNIPVMIGGPQATALGEEFLDASGCDVISRYEGEITVLDLLNYYVDGVGDLSDIKGIMYKKDGRVVLQPEQDLIENLDALPFIDDDCYLEGRQPVHQLSIMTGRGCPFHCAFCHEGHHTKQVRFRSVDNVLQEIELFLEKETTVENPYILFTDDTFTLLPERVKAICDGLKKLQKKRPFRWFCEGHIHMLSTYPEMISYIAEAGAMRIQLGIEAGTQEVLDAYRKGSTLDEIRQVVKMCRDKGIEQIYSNIILGGAFYTEEVYKKNVEFAKELISLGEGTVEIGTVCYWPLPETSITNHPCEYGIKILDAQFITSVGDFPQTETSQLDRWDILKMAKDMQNEINDYMTMMLQQNKIPKDRIFKWMNLIRNGDLYGYWCQCLNSNFNLYAYYDLLFSKEAVTSEEVADIWEAHPMRVISLVSNITYKNKKQFIYGSCHLNELEMEILIYATGKLSLNEIVDKVKSVFPDIKDQMIKRCALDAMNKLEQQHLIVFSKY